MKEYKELLNNALAYSEDYFDHLEEQPVFPTPESLALLDHFDVPLKEQGMPATEVLAQLHDYGSPNTVASNGSRYFGFVTGGTYPIGQAAKWLGTTWDQNSALYVMSPIVSKLEEVSQQWLIDLLELKTSTGVGFLSGSSEATLCGLLAARNTLLKRKGYDVVKEGLINCPPIKVIMSEEIHGSVWKALNFLGIGQKNVTLVPTNENGSIKIENFPEIDDSTIVVIQAGNINSGSFDPIGPIAEKVHQSRGWLHVDGAIGLWARASEEKRFLVEGLEEADSMSASGHKLLNLPYDCGLLFCSHKQEMIDALQVAGDYLQFDPEKRDNIKYTLEMSRRSRVIELWATLNYLGKQGVAALVDQLCENARYFAEKLTAQGAHILNEIDFNQVLFTLESEEETAELLEKIQTSGLFWCSGTTWQGKKAIRLSVSSWKITQEDIDQCLAFIQANK